MLRPAAGSIVGSGGLCGGGQPGASEARRVKAAVSWSRQGQAAGRWSVRRRPERVRRPATWRRRWRSRFGFASASSPSSTSSRSQASRSWANSASSNQALFGCECLEGQPAEPELLGFLDAVLDACVEAVTPLELGDVSVGLVGEEALVAVPVGVAEAQLRARVRPFLAHDQARPCSASALRSTWSVSSATQAPSRACSPPSSAGSQRFFGTASAACPTRSST